MCGGRAPHLSVPSFKLGVERIQPEESNSTISTLTTSTLTSIDHLQNIGIMYYWCSLSNDVGKEEKRKVVPTGLEPTWYQALGALTTEP